MLYSFVYFCSFAYCYSDTVHYSHIHNTLPNYVHATLT